MVDLLLFPVRLSIHIRDTHSRYSSRVLRRNICEEKWVLGWDVNCQLVNVAIVNCWYIKNAGPRRPRDMIFQSLIVKPSIFRDTIYRFFFFTILPRFRKGRNPGNKRGQWGTRPPGWSANRKRASSLAVDFFDAITGVDYFDADALFGSSGKSSASRYNLGAIGYWVGNCQVYVNRQLVNVAIVNCWYSS